MKKLLLILGIVALIGGLAVVASVGYFVGYRAGHKAAVRGQLIFDLRENLHLYRLAQAGDTNRVQSGLRFLVFSDSDYYDRNFGHETVTNKYFLQDLADARAIAGQERTQVVSLDSVVQQVNQELATNRQPNAPEPVTNVPPTSTTNE